MRGPLPPFADSVIAILQDPEALRRHAGCTNDRASIWILTGPDAPEMHRYMQSHLTVLLPHPGRPGDFYWGFLAGHEPALVWCDSLDYRLVAEIWAALERDGIRSALFGNGEWPGTYKKNMEDTNALRGIRRTG